jgi:RES domain-containing protein
VRLFRITQQVDRAAAFDGVGASMFPGRWNERMRRMVYTTTRLPLGILEVALQASGAALTGYLAYPLEVPDGLLETLDRSVLSPTWRSAAAGRAECRQYGEAWRARGTTVGLIVPSAVVPEAYDFGDVNVVLNPLHSDFSRLAIGDSIQLDLDMRLQALISNAPSSRRPASGAAQTRRKPS